MEIERKFTVRKLPDNLDSYPFHIIEQAYLNTDPVVRIRREDDAFYLTYKGKGMMAREEYNLPLNRMVRLTCIPRKSQEGEPYYEIMRPNSNLSTWQQDKM